MTHGPSHAMSEAFLGIDLGTSSVKALVVDPDGTVRGTGSAEYPVLRPQPGWAEQDPDAWWEATSTAVQQAVGWSGTDVSIGGVGFSGQMHGAAFLGENERVLSRPIPATGPRRCYSMRAGATGLLTCSTRSRFRASCYRR